MLCPRKGSLMKTQTQILDNRLYFTRKIELHRKCKKSHTVQITTILISGICCSPHLTGKSGTRPIFQVGPGAGPEPTRARLSQKCLGPRRHSTYWGRLRHRAINPTSPKGVKAWGKAPWCRRKSPGTETHSARSVPQITRPAKALSGNWRGSDRDWSVSLAAKSLSTYNGERSPLRWDG